MRGIEHVLFFFYSWEKILCVYDVMTFRRRKKKDLKIGFLKYGIGENPPFGIKDRYEPGMCKHIPGRIRYMPGYAGACAK